MISPACHGMFINSQCPGGICSWLVALCLLKLLHSKRKLSRNFWKITHNCLHHLCIMCDELCLHLIVLPLFHVARKIRLLTDSFVELVRQHKWRDIYWHLLREIYWRKALFTDNNCLREFMLSKIIQLYFILQSTRCAGKAMGHAKASHSPQQSVIPCFGIDYILQIRTVRYILIHTYV